LRVTEVRAVSKVVSIRLKDEQVAALQRTARHWRKNPSATAAQLVEQALRMRDFPFIEFRDTIRGPEAFLKGTRLRVFWIVIMAQDYGGNLQKAAEHLGVPAAQVECALRYAEAYADEIRAAIAELEAMSTEEALRRLIPNLEVFTVRDRAVGQDEASA
jgi:uncharacterized protein (DUF433 family)